ncbi:hypothetical protein GJ496_004182 [Pomphorhynchus laevis]|nr:hypothetical protein GJ496_004182 [Pomphorhynchus laevis]
MDECNTKVDTDDLCVMCTTVQAKYTCPQCLRRTCSLNCCKSHKQQYSCKGELDSTEFKSMDRFTKLDFLRDFRYLEEMQRVIDSIHKDPFRNNFENRHRKRVRNECRKLGIRLLYMPIKATRQIKNRTWFNYKCRAIEWTVEFLIKGESKPVYVHRVKSTDTLKSAFLKMNSTAKLEIDSFELYYKDYHPSDSFEHSDWNSQLIDCLRGKTIVEMPIFELRKITAKSVAVHNFLTSSFCQ